MTPQQRINTYIDLPKQFQSLYSSPETTELNKAMKSKFAFTEEQYDSYLDITGDTILGFYHTKDLPQLLQKEVGASSEDAQKIVAELAEFLSPVLEREAAASNAKQDGLKELTESFAARTQNAPKHLPTQNEADTPSATDPTPADTLSDNTPAAETTEAMILPTEPEKSNEDPAEESTPAEIPSKAAFAPLDPDTEYDVRPMRTMKGDMERIHGYGAYRAEHPLDAEAEDTPTIKSSQEDILPKNSS